MERTYTVTWRKPDGKVITCQGLSPRVAFARLWAAWKGAGEITVLSVEPEWVTDDSLVSETWPYPIPPPICQDRGEDEKWTCIVYDGTGLWCPACVLWSEENAALIESGATTSSEIA